MSAKGAVLSRLYRITRAASQHTHINPSRARRQDVAPGMSVPCSPGQGGSKFDMRVNSSSYLLMHRLNYTFEVEQQKCLTPMFMEMLKCMSTRKKDLVSVILERCSPTVVLKIKAVYFFNVEIILLISCVSLGFVFIYLFFFLVAMK